MAVARDTMINGANSSTAVYTISITVGASVGLMVVEIGGGSSALSAAAGAARVTDISIPAGSLTRVYTDPVTGGGAAGEVYAILDPPAGTYNITFTRAAGGYAPFTFVARTWTGVDNSSLANAMSVVTRQGASSVSGVAYTSTSSVSNATDDMTCSWMAAQSSFTAAAVTAGFQTADGTANNADSFKHRSGYQLGAGLNVTHSYDLQADIAGRTAHHFYYSIKKAPAGGGGGGGAGIDSPLMEGILVGKRLTA